MAGVNKVILLGRTGKTPEVRSLQSGGKVANFQLATSDTYKDKNGEKKEVTEWHNIVFYGPLAQVIESYVKKGDQLYVEGKLRTRSYEDKEGVKKYITEVLGSTMTMVGWKSEGKAESVPTVMAEEVPNKDSDDLPF